MPTSGAYVGDWEIDALAGNDTVIGWYGNDTFYGAVGDDYLYGHVGNDQLFGEAGNDTLFGDNDQDYLDGGEGSDYLFGGNGNDTLFGGGSPGGNGYADVLKGGAGDDCYYHDFARGGVSVISDTDGGQFNNGDIIRLLNAPTPLRVGFGSDRSTLYIYQDGEFADGSFDNGVMIQGMLTNLGYDSAGTIEVAYVNGNIFSNWLPAVHSTWSATFDV